MNTAYLVTGSTDTGTVTYWDSNGRIIEIVYYPAITDASFNSDWPGAVYGLSKSGGHEFVLYKDSSRVSVASDVTLDFQLTHQYTGSQFPIAVFSVGTENWVFYQDTSNNNLYLDKYSSGLSITTVTVDSSGSVGNYNTVATWDNNTFYIISGQNNPDVYSWTVGGGDPIFVRNIKTDLANGNTGSQAGDGLSACMHGPNILAVTTRSRDDTFFEAHPSIGLFDTSSSCAFIKRYIFDNSVSSYTTTNWTLGNFTPFGICSDGTYLWTGTVRGSEIYKINTSTDSITLWNQDIQVFDSSITSDPRYPTIPAVFPVDHADPNLSSHSLDGMTGFSRLAFDGYSVPMAHFDGLMDSTDYRFWPEIPPSPPIIIGVLGMNGLEVSADVTVTNGSSGPFDYELDWGDGLTSNLNSASSSHLFSHTYQDSTSKIITIYLIDTGTSLRSNTVLLYPTWGSFRSKYAGFI